MDQRICKAMDKWSEFRVNTLNCHVRLINICAIIVELKCAPQWPLVISSSPPIPACLSLDDDTGNEDDDGNNYCSATSDDDKCFVVDVFLVRGHRGYRVHSSH